MEPNLSVVCLRCDLPQSPGKSQNSLHDARCTTFCFLPGVTLVQKYVPGVSRTGPWWANRESSAYDRVSQLKDLLTSKNIARPSLVILNCMWWDLGHFQVAHDHTSGWLPATLVKEYYVDLKHLVSHVQHDFGVVSQQLVLPTSIHRIQNDPEKAADIFLNNFAAAQLNAAMRHVAVELDLHMTLNFK